MAYLLSGPRSQHPYLLWASLAVGLGWSGEGYARLTGGPSSKRKGGDAAGNRRRAVREGSWTEDEEWVAEEGGALNGEVVREGLEGWRIKQGVKAGVWGVGWAVAVVGLWGDGA